MTSIHADHHLAANRGDATRNALIQAAIEVFGRDGYHAVSTRTLSKAAAVNQALIGYHFGGKQGLYLAVFDHIVENLQARVGPLAEALEMHFRMAAVNLPLAERREQFLPHLLGVCDAVLTLMLSEDTAHWSQLIMREQQKPTEAFNRFYEGIMGRLLGLLTRLVQYLRGESESHSAQVIVVGILGNLLIWRAAREGVRRHMQWKGFTEPETAIVRERVLRGIVAQVFA